MNVNLFSITPNKDNDIVPYCKLIGIEFNTKIISLRKINEGILVAEIERPVGVSPVEVLMIDDDYMFRKCSLEIIDHNKRTLVLSEMHYSWLINNINEFEYLSNEKYYIFSGVSINGKLGSLKGQELITKFSEMFEIKI